ncbi:unnamed protein product, partial [Polarella glacialis]
FRPLQVRCQPLVGCLWSSPLRLRSSVRTRASSATASPSGTSRSTNTPARLRARSLIWLCRLDS